MLLSEFVHRSGNYFIAMEYYWLVLNRTYLVLLTEDYLVGIKANGLVMAEAAAPDILTAAITSYWTIKGNLQDPKSYLNPKYLDRIEHTDLMGDDFLRMNRSNFRLRYSDIAAVEFNPARKFGMGNYPNGRRVYVKMKSGGKREFIILGDQWAKGITDWIASRIS